MRDELFPYYERELAFIRQMAAGFQEKHAADAPGLLLEDGKSDDPHVERLIEAFALIAGRIRHKIEDEFPEITEALLEMLYPHFLRPVPSQAIVQFELDRGQSTVPEAKVIQAKTNIHARSANGEICTFRTGYDVRLWPLKVARASISGVSRFDAEPGMAKEIAATLRIEMECLGGLKLSQIPIDSLRFYLKGGNEVNALYESLFVNALQVTLQTDSAPGSARVVFPASQLRQVGFAEDEGLLPYSDRSFLGYRLLQEYFTFPEKFFFVDLVGLDKVSLQGFSGTFEIVIEFKKFEDGDRLARLEQSVTAQTFQLGCAPMINLFEISTEPIRVTQTKTEYLIIPDQHRPLHTEIYSVDEVISSSADQTTHYEPFYSLRHSRDEKEKLKRFWYTHRRPAFRKNDNGTDVYLSLVDLDFQPAVPDVEVLTVHATCTNREQAWQDKLRLGDEFGALEVEGAALVRARCVRKPTQPVRPSLRHGLQWRLISHLSLNHLSIVESGREALQEILRLYNFRDDQLIRKQINGIISVSSEPAVSRIVSKTGVTFCRGVGVTINFDETAFAGSSVYLFASVIEKFLGLYSAVNSFSRLRAVTSRGELKQWRPLAGEQILL